MVTHFNFLNMSDLSQFASQLKGKGGDILELETSQVGAAFLCQVQYNLFPAQEWLMCNKTFVERINAVLEYN